MKQNGRQNESGQIIIEYILLMIIGVGLALLITSTLVSRNPDNPGFLITKWVKIIQTIGADPIDHSAE